MPREVNSDTIVFVAASGNINEVVEIEIGKRQPVSSVRGKILALLKGSVTLTEQDGGGPRAQSRHREIGDPIAVQVSGGYRQRQRKITSANLTSLGERAIPMAEECHQGTGA